MPCEESASEIPEGFNQIVRLFPLSELILFPGVIQALHLFESRHQQLVADAVATDQLMATAFVWPQSLGIAGSPDRPEPIRPTVCVAKIIAHTRLAGGPYNILIQGIERARIVREVDFDTPYRTAKIELLCDTHPLPEGREATVRRQVLDQFFSLASPDTSIDEKDLAQMVTEEMPMGRLLDLICYASGARPADQHEVLATTDIGRRAELVLSLLKKRHQQERAQSDLNELAFPPDFSQN